MLACRRPVTPLFKVKLKPDTQKKVIKGLYSAKTQPKSKFVRFFFLLFCFLKSSRYSVQKIDLINKLHFSAMVLKDISRQ